MTQAISPLRQRMIDDMRMRKFSPKTQSAYLRAVLRLAAFLGRTPDSPATRICAANHCTWWFRGISPTRSTRRSPH